MSDELDRNRVMKLLIDNLPPREKDYWQRSMEVVEKGLQESPKTDICPLCQKGGHDV